MTRGNDNELAGARVLGGPSPAYLKATPEPYLVSNYPLSLPWTPRTAPFFLPCPLSTSKSEAELPSIAKIHAVPTPSSPYNRITGPPRT